MAAGAASEWCRSWATVSASCWRGFPSALVLAPARLWLDRMDNQENARTLFGRGLVVFMLLSTICCLIWAPDLAPEPPKDFTKLRNPMTLGAARV